jgi:hypothetical protein
MTRRAAGVGADLEETWPESQWYAMLFPTGEESLKLAAQLAELARLTGGTIYPNVHVTVGYFSGDADPARIVALSSGLDRPAITIRASGLFSWTEAKHPTDGYSLSLQVIRDEAISEWQRRAIAALAGAELTPTFSWEEQNPHVAVLRDLPASPAEVLVRLGSQDFALEFRANRLVISQRVGGEFITRLDQPLRGDA